MWLTLLNAPFCAGSFFLAYGGCDCPVPLSHRCEPVEQHVYRQALDNQGLNATDPLFVLLTVVSQIWTEVVLQNGTSRAVNNSFTFAGFVCLPSRGLCGRLSSTDAFPLALRLPRVKK